MKSRQISVLSRTLSLWFFFCASNGFAFDLGLSSMSPPEQQKTILRYNGMLQPKESVANSAADVGVLQTNLSASVPVYRGEKDAVALSARYNWLNFYPAQPQIANLADLYDVQFGASYTHQIEEKRLWSVAASFGSASDKPFKDSSVDTVSATALYSFPGSETESWVLLLNYSNNRPILNNIPLPGFAYTYAPSKSFRGTFGIPFASIYWQFEERWSLTLFTVAPWVAKAQVAYSVMGPMQAYAGIDFSQMTFLQYGRTNSKERLYYDEKKAFVGLKSPLSRVLFAELEGGYSFGRRIFSAESYTTHPANPTELGASPYGRVSLSAAF